MSYLHLQSPILTNYSKAIISLWFRVPKRSIEKCAAMVVPPAFTFNLPFTLPLITFGKPQIRKRYEATQEFVATGSGADYMFEHLRFEGSAITYSTTADDPVDNSYIGVNCEGGTAHLVVNLQTANFALLTNSHWSSTTITSWIDSDPSAPAADLSPGTGWVRSAPVTTFYAPLADNAYVDNAQPEFVFAKSQIEVTPDKWHHLLLSFDLSNGFATRGVESGDYVEGTTASSKMWIALDDVNKTGDEAFGNAWLYGGGDNEILSDNAVNYIFQFADRTGQNRFVSAGECIVGACSIPNGPIGIPAIEPYVERILNVDMGELQFFAGISLDTADLSNRRAFITADGLPVEPGEAEKFLGRRPDILLHGTGDWQDGRNTGRLGTTIDDDGNETELPTGQFKHIGKIDPFEPDPELGK